VGHLIAVETLRPSKAAYRSAVTAQAVIALPLLGVAVVRLWGAPIGAFVALVVVLLLISVGIFLHFRNTRIDFGDGQISRTTMFNKTTTWPLSDIGTVLTVRSLIAFMAPTTENVFVLDTAGRLIVRATDQRWSFTQLRNLVEATEKTPVVLKKPIDALRVRSQYPGAIAWWEAHTFKTAFIATGVLMVIVAAGVAFYMSDLVWQIPQWFRQTMWRLGLS
jgi:hypothetical protein